MLLTKLNKASVLYLIAVIFGIFAAVSGIHFLQILGQVIAEIFIKIFKCISIPIIALSIIVTLSSYATSNMSLLLKRTAFHTFITTIIAATVSCGLYLLIKPANVSTVSVATSEATKSINYGQYLTNIIPANFLSPFIENQAISVLLIGIIIGAAIRHIPDEDSKKVVTQFFKGMHGFFFIITKWIVAILPIGLFGFISTTIVQIQHGGNFKGISQYITIIVLANLIQGFVVLPAWLKFHGISPFKTMRNMLPALSLAFFSKSSAGTLPMTIATAEKSLNMNPEVSRFVLPLCTNINMNGCAAFIFVTVIYLMQNNGISISPVTMCLWIIISTIAAIGNAGVPMGCFFLSASLLASMNVPITLLGIILPMYSAIDMIETTLNVWSDSCVAKVIDQQLIHTNDKTTIYSKCLA